MDDQAVIKFAKQLEEALEHRDSAAKALAAAERHVINAREVLERTENRLRAVRERSPLNGAV